MTFHDVLNGASSATSTESSWVIFAISKTFPMRDCTVGKSCPINGKVNLGFLILFWAWVMLLGLVRSSNFVKTLQMYKNSKKDDFHHLLLWLLVPSLLIRPLISPKNALFLLDFNLFLQNAPKMTYASKWSILFRPFWYMWEVWAIMSSPWKIRKTINFRRMLSESVTLQNSMLQ